MIHNRHGPLLPTVRGGPDAQAKELSALSKTLGSAVNCQNLSAGPSGATIIERLENAEKHLNLVTKIQGIPIDYGGTH
ncbi:hypothetical protein L0F63_002636 [Massospora cicadina]|nr:hypothetical protein L0F63_002636 [Massospora cicadina]